MIIKILRFLIPLSYIPLPILILLCNFYPVEEGAKYQIVFYSLYLLGFFAHKISGNTLSFFYSIIVNLFSSWLIIFIILDEKTQLINRHHEWTNIIGYIKISLTEISVVYILFNLVLLMYIYISKTKYGKL